MFAHRFATFEQINPNLRRLSGYTDPDAYKLLNVVDIEIRFAEYNDHADWALVDYNTQARTALIAHRNGQWFVVTCPPKMEAEWLEADSYEKAIGLFERVTS